MGPTEQMEQTERPAPPVLLAPREQTESMGQMAQPVQPGLPAQQASRVQRERPEPLVQLRRSWTETWATATPLKVTVRSPALYPASVTRPRVLKPYLVIQM